jgi:predicted RNA-binding protein with PUA-like domain
MKISFDDTERAVMAALRKLDHSYNKWKTGQCTSEVKKACLSVGRKFGFNVYATDLPGKTYEWLYDVCWCKEDKHFVINMPLAMECEWRTSRDDIVWDFQKLLVSRALHRIFLTSQPVHEDWVDDVEHLIDHIHSYQGTQNGDRYLFGNWEDIDGWQFCQYVHPMRPPAGNDRVWLFQALPDYDLLKELKRKTTVDWPANRYHNRMRVGQKILFWQSGSAAGIYGWGEIAAEVNQKKNGKRRIDVRYTKLLNQPILESTLCKNAVLKGMSILRKPHRGTQFRVQPSEWEILKPLLGVK